MTAFFIEKSDLIKPEYSPARLREFTKGTDFIVVVRGHGYFEDGIFEKNKCEGCDCESKRN